MEEEQQSYSEQSDARYQRPRGFRMRVLFVALFIIVALAAAGVFSLSFPRVDKSKWQAVFLINNQVYFGHLRKAARGYVRLEDIFYLRVSEGLQQGGTATTDVNLVKLGSELHGPEDVMYIPTDKILFWENLKNDSQVVASINANFSENQ